MVARDRHLRLRGSVVLRFGHAYHKHDLVMGSDDILNDLLRLRIDDATLLIILLLRLTRQGITVAIYDIIVWRAALLDCQYALGLSKVQMRYTSAWDVSGPSLPIIADSSARG